MWFIWMISTLLLLKNLYFDFETPLASSSVDIAVFCLSLMGTNFPSYIQEANRVLKPQYAFDFIFLFPRLIRPFHYTTFILHVQRVAFNSWGEKQTRSNHWRSRPEWFHQSHMRTRICLQIQGCRTFHFRIIIRLSQPLLKVIFLCAGPLEQNVYTVSLSKKGLFLSLSLNSLITDSGITFFCFFTSAGKTKT